MNTADEQAAEEYYTLLGTYIRELNKAHKGIRRLVRRNRKLEAERDSLQQELSDSAKQIEAASAELLALSTSPPCRECGAMTEDEANTKCICAGDKDSCAGCGIWGD